MDQMTEQWKRKVSLMVVTDHSHQVSDLLPHVAGWNFAVVSQQLLLKDQAAVK